MRTSMKCVQLRNAYKFVFHISEGKHFSKLIQKRRQIFQTFRKFLKLKIVNVILMQTLDESFFGQVITEKIFDIKRYWCSFVDHCHAHMRFSYSCYFFIRWKWVSKYTKLPKNYNFSKVICIFYIYYFLKFIFHISTKKAEHNIFRNAPLLFHCAENSELDKTVNPDRFLIILHRENLEEETWHSSF